MQNDLDRMQLPDTIRWRIQAAMPMLIPSMRCSLSCQPPSVSNSALVCLQPSITNPGSNSSSSTIPQRNSVLSRVASNASGKSKLQDNDLEIDPWTLLEDGAGSYPSAGNTASIVSGDHANIRATSWLKGAVRVRRTDLTYVGAVDDDSWLTIFFVGLDFWSIQTPQLTAGDCSFVIYIWYLMHEWHEDVILCLPFLCWSLNEAEGALFWKKMGEGRVQDSSSNGSGLFDHPHLDCVHLLSSEVCCIYGDMIVLLYQLIWVI